MLDTERMFYFLLTVGRSGRSEGEHDMATRKATQAPTPEVRPACLCGCGGTPKGKTSRFISGHDARYHSALKRAEKEAAK